MNNYNFDNYPCDKRIQSSTDPEKMICQIATSRQPFEVEVAPTFCEACLKCGGYKTDDNNKGIRLASMYSAKKQSKELYQLAETYNGDGPGTELKKLIPKWLERPECGCANFAKKMNIWGPDLCERNIEQIVDKLHSESKKLAMFSWVPDVCTRTVCYKLASTAIKRAREKEGSLKNKWFVAVTTAPRKEQTLSICLDSLLINGWRPYIFAEPGNYDYLNEEYRSNLIIHKERKGVWWNWVESCRYALDNSDADIIMTVQDDSLFHPDSKDIAEMFMWPSKDIGFISLYTPKHYSSSPKDRSNNRPVGINKITTKALWGACALIWPRVVLEKVMKHELIEGWLGAPLKTASAWEERKKKRKEEPWTIQNSDTAIGKIMNRMGRSMWFIDPSPVQHIAKYSAINHGGNEGRRNCGRCANYKIPLKEQVPFLFNGESAKTFSTKEIELG